MRRSQVVDSLPGERPVLEVRFETLEDFRREYEANLSKGGLFIRSREPLELRQEVEVRLDLAFRSTRMGFAGEVVSVVPPELARAGGTPGVAVQLLAAGTEIRRRLEPLTGRPPDPDPARQVGERRLASRLPARAMGRMSTEDASLAVRTRDLSHTGVLVTLDGIPPPPVGERVRLSLTHPRTDQALEVEGRVVRHLESEGSVPAVAVAFTEREAARAEVARFVEDLGSRGHARSLGGISGALEPMGLASLLQSFAGAAPAGTLTATRGAEEGRVVFQDGRLRLARLGPVSGTKALARMLGWKDGHFEFEARADEAADPEQEELGLEHALLDASRQLDERARLGPPPLPPSARPRVAAARPGNEDGLSKTEEAVLDLARAGFSVRGMLDVIPEEDHVILRALAALLDRGVLSAD